MKKSYIFLWVILALGTSPSIGFAAQASNPGPGPSPSPSGEPPKDDGKNGDKDEKADASTPKACRELASRLSCGPRKTCHLDVANCLAGREIDAKDGETGTEKGESKLEQPLETNRGDVYNVQSTGSIDRGLAGDGRFEAN
ncbi:MAG: hypothetical protein AB7P04_11515 [Bacteriovoracia bacterium]